MKLHTVNGYYGSGNSESEIYVASTSRGNWYVVAGSVNVNFTPADVDDGVNVEELPDTDMFTAGAPINSEEELEAAIDD